MTNPKHQKPMTNITLENIGSFIAQQGLDALVLSKFFKQVNFSQEQAEAIAEVVSKIPLANEKLVETKLGNFEERNSQNLALLAQKSDISRLELEIEKVKSDLIKWTAGLMIANTGLLFTLIKFFN